MRCRLIILSSAVVVVALALLAAGCGSQANQVAHVDSTATQSAGSSNARGATSSGLLAFSQCMRSHGVPSFPDPQPGASNAKSPSAQQLGVAGSQLSAAEDACEHLLPAGVDDRFPPAEVPLLLRGMARFSQCMRSHGVPNWPDPSVDSEGGPVFLLSAHGFTLQQAHSPEITHAVDECQHLLPSALGGMPTG